MSTIVMVGGGVQEAPAVRTIQSLGYRVLVTDRNPGAAAFKEADCTLVADGRDIETLAADVCLLKKDLGICGVFTLTELVTSVAAIAEIAELPGVPIKAAVSCQHKALAKSIWLEKGVATPRGGVAMGLAEAKKIFEQLQGPAFVKPVVAFGGQGARQVGSTGDLTSIFAGKPASSFVVEEALSGSMHDVNGLIDREGSFHPLGIVDREFLPDHVVERGIQTPSRLSQTHQQELYRLLERGVRALGVGFGPVKGDCVMADDGASLLEVAPRLHGPRSSLFALPISGFSPLIPTILALAGKTPSSQSLEIRQNRYCMGRALLPRPGRLKEIIGVRAANSLAGVEGLLLFTQPGMRIGEYRDSTQIPGYVFVSGESIEECQRTTEQVQNLIQFRTEP